ncbi:Arrestin domain-containing protein B [Phytophthora cinnamomi]|uniref:Arrestin domain-containing protein B n=1 Tax=Phytophthora cinnamomi TaxID=4785 RepID=UPI003559AFD9|nr:Arrestin domain-containing protein B [Phytophthora cinnamomi]
MSDQRYIKEGWLMKRSRSGRVVANWRRRYFRLTRTELLYYKSPQDPAPRRRYELTLDSNVLRTNDQGYPLCIVFQPAPGQPSFFMQAENEVEKDEWLTAIYNAYRRTPDVAQQSMPTPEVPKADPAPSTAPMPPQPPPPPPPPARILLDVTVEEARKLKAADFNGKSDPYCVVKLVGKDGQLIDIEEKKTDVKTSTLEPEWRKHFQIGRVVDLNTVKAVQFDLWDHDTFKRHDSLGSVQVPFSRFSVSPASMAQSNPIDDWFRVEPPKKTGFSSSPRRNDTREKEHVVKDWGELHVRMSISGPNLVDFFHATELEFVPTSPVATILTGHGLSPADLNGYSDPYCTLSITDRTTGKDIETEKKRTAVISKTLNPVWSHENFIFGNNAPLSEARSLLIHVKDHNNIGRSTPLGRVEIPLYDLCRASADFTSISSKEVVKRYELQPEPWMKKHAKHLGELCIQTEMVGNATVLAELMQRMSNIPMEKSLSILSFSEANIQSEVSMQMSMSAADFDESELEDETTEIIQRGVPIRTSTSKVLVKNTATWRKEKFSFSLSYPGIFSEPKYPTIETQLLQLRIHEARNLLLSDAAGNPTSRGFLKPETELSSESRHQKQSGRALDTANIFFTIIPVRGDGTLEEAERAQSLTVYNSRDPTWPKEKFVFGKIKDISNVSYLSLHLYGRDVQSDEQAVLSKLLPDEEKQADELPKKTLKRLQLHKLSPAGEIDDDGFEILQYDQRVLAFRGGEDGGRFYPARVQRYIPFPRDEYEVHFEDKIETIEDLRNLLSFDVEGVVQAVRNDGRVDVIVERESSGSVHSKDSSRYTVMPTQLIPLEKGLTDEVQMVMARRFNNKNEGLKQWKKMQHEFSGIVIDISSVSNLLMPIYDGSGKLLDLKPLDETNEPSCRLTLLGNPGQTDDDLFKLNDHGELLVTETIAVSSKRTWEKGSALEATVELDSAAELSDDEAEANDGTEPTIGDRAPTTDFEISPQAQAANCGDTEMILFQKKPLVLGVRSSKPDCKESESDDDMGKEHVDTMQADRGSRILKMTSSILIRVNAKIEMTGANEAENKAAKTPKNKATKAKVPSKRMVERTIGYARVDLASLELGEKELRLEIVPVDAASARPLQQSGKEDTVPYYLSLGSLLVDITTHLDTPQSQQTPGDANKTDVKEPRLWDRELSTWYNHQLETEPSSIYTRGATWIERRQFLRSSLTPLGNAQIDALHTILVVIMKRIVNILREIRQFENFEMLSVDEMRKCRLIHTVNAIPNSENLGLTMEKLSPDTRREIVVGLENELLDLAGVKREDNVPKPGISREEWVDMRTKRQQLLREHGDFFMSTSTSILSVPRSFTGKGIIAWILRKPPVLCSGKWREYSKDPARAAIKLGWDAKDMVKGLGALREPIDESDALQWMSALCAAGFVENVTPGIVTIADFGKRQVFLENRADRFYRLHEIDMWMEKLPRENSLYPLDLVQEIDCYCPPMSNALKEHTGSDPNDTVKHNKIYRKKLTEHCDGFLGMHSMISDILFSVKGWASRLPSVIRKPDEHTTEKTEETSQAVEKLLWNWRYCLFIPSRRQLYMYEHESSTYPMAFMDMACAGCKVAYNVKGGWLDIMNPAVYTRKPDSRDYAPATTEALAEMTKTREKEGRVIELKTPNTQKWIHALARSGVCVEMRPGQRVLMKRLNPIVLQQKCNKHATRFKPNDLEGSFHRLLNRLFGHDKELSHQDRERERRDQRAQVRSELKKAGAEGDVVMAYYGKGKQPKSKPMYSGNFKNGSLYSARILRIRTPFTEEHYPFKTKYDMRNEELVPKDLMKLLAKYSVVDHDSWLDLPKSQRDMFLLYDVEYSHANERIVEEGLMRVHIRTNEGDLDPQKVSEKCTDLNIMFKATDLENCVSRMLKHRYQHKPLGVLKIPITMISPHRTIDAWYPLAPASDMLQKTRLGQIRVELKRVQKREIKRSAKVLEAVTSEISSQPAKENKLTPQDTSSKTNKKKNPFTVGREPSFVKVSILEGRSLRVADLFTSDPFVEIVLLDDEDSKEQDTGLKTDIKMKTLNPKWENQEFLLGKTEKTMLSNKKEDSGQLEGMIEWYAIEEAKFELERIPYHRIATEAEKKNWLPYSRDGKDTRLMITQEEMVFTPANVRFALEERGVIPTTSNFDPTNTDTAASIKPKYEAWVSPSLADPESGSQSVTLPIAVSTEISQLEKLLEKRRDDSQQTFSLPNPERVAELYEAIESLGKTDLLWNVDHVVSKNRELAVPENYQLLLREMTIRQIPTTEVENLVKSLAFAMQREVLIEKGITVPTTANPTTLLQLMHRYQIKEVTLPKDTGSIQMLLQERGMDRKGDPVMLRGIRIGTQSTGAASIQASSGAASSTKALNTGLGIIDTQIELLRKTLLLEALLKRNSLIRTFAGESHVLDEEIERMHADMFAAAVESAEVDVSGDYLTLVERFQRQLVHESYTRRLAEYAALDRCVRALLGKDRDEIVTKEDIAMELHNVNKRVIGANYRLPPEAFTEDELKKAASAGRIRSPSDEMLERCPKGKNASAMAHYAAISYGANVFQEVLLDRLLLFEAANKMDMVKTEMLLREVRDKTSRLREREQEAQTKLEERYQSNLELLEQLVTLAERCMNNRKLHSEETPVLLHKLEQVCIVPSGLNERHREAYHTVATHWLPQQQHLSELAKMHREGTFSISRTPELLGRMKYHTEGKAGSEELNEEKVAASAQRVAPELQATFVDRKLNEVRLGQRKEPSSLHLDLSEDEDATNQSVDDAAWKELSHSKRVVQPLSPHEKQASWKLVKNAVAANAALSASSPKKDKVDKLKVEIGPKVTAQPASPRRKLSLSEELKVLLRSPTQWLTGSSLQEETIAPELYFPKEVVLETPGTSLAGPISK